MADVIGYQDGINAAEQNLKALDPSHAAGYDKLADTLRTVKGGHNEVWKVGGLADRVAALEKSRPFFP